MSNDAPPALPDPGELFIISAPSGSGKTTLAYALVERTEHVVFSRSTTTRPARPDETNGVDYNFVDDATFDEMIQEDAFLEWARVVEHRYGTPAAFIDEQVAAGRDVVLNIDVQGALSVRKVRDDAVLIFVLPPSFEELQRRLVKRADGAGTNVRARLETGLQEVQAMDQFDYVVVNDDLEDALATLGAILRAHRALRERMQAAARPILRSFEAARDQGFDAE